jgi:conjugal transfer mating pair stabilization protein TraN
VERIKAEVNYTCDEGARLENDTCIRELIQPAIETKGCKEGLTESNGYCTGTLTEKTKDGYKCNSGTYNSKTGKCDNLTYVGKATKKCKEEHDIVLDNGKCAAAHPGAHSYGEPGEVDPATECCCGDTFKNGWCYSLPNGNYDAIVSCPSGSTYTKGDKGNGCYKSTASAATPAKTCDAGYTLNGDTCTKNVKEKVIKVLKCENGYELRKTDDCFKKETTPAKPEYRCEEGYDLTGSDCVKVEVKELN